MARRTMKDFTKGATPAGVFVFPHLQVPNTRFKPEGEYQVSLDLSGQAAADLQKIIDEAFETEFAHECENHGKQVRRSEFRPYGPATDRDKNEIPGMVRFKFSKKASGTYGPKHPKAGEKWTAHFPIWPAAGTTAVTDPIWGGTVGRISYKIVPWFTNALGFGVRLQIEAVKIITLVTQGERAPEDYGFEDEEGYVPTVNASGQTNDGGNDDEADVATETEGGIDF